MRIQVRCEDGEEARRRAVAINNGKPVHIATVLNTPDGRLFIFKTVLDTKTSLNWED